MQSICAMCVCRLEKNYYYVIFVKLNLWETDIYGTYQCTCLIEFRLIMTPM